MKVGDKVIFGDFSTIGYIVKIEIDPIDEYDVDFQNPEQFATYTVRVFKPFYKDGHFDFRRSRDEIALY